MRTMVVVYLLCLILGGAGWIQNVYKLTQCDFASPYKAEVVHLVGLVPVVGAITGWINVGK